MDIKHLYSLNPVQFTEEVKVLFIESNEVPVFISAIFPTQAGHAGEFLQTDGTNLLWASTGGGGFITAVGDTATVNLTVTGTTLTADFTSLLISQFTNDSGYITSAGVPSLPLSGANGGTGVANTGFTITLAGNLITTGAFNTTIAAVATGTYTLPASTSTLASLTLAETFLTGVKTFRSSILAIRNPANTFSYTIAAAAITAARTLTLPLLTGNSTLIAHNTGLTGGTTIIGGTAAGEGLTLTTTTNGTKGSIYFGAGGSIGAFNETDNSGNFNVFGFDVNGVQIKSGSGPTAFLDIGPGSGTSGEGQIKLQASTILATPEDGVIENDGTSLYYTPNGGVQNFIPISTNTTTGGTTPVGTVDIIINGTTYNVLVT